MAKIIPPWSEVKKYDDGLSGPTGRHGPLGEHGPQGDTGFQGDTGLSGSCPGFGPTGIPGIDGWDGLRGATGEEGLKGEKGPTGSQGEPNFEKGTLGGTGVQGVLGMTGLQGETGEIGSVGLEGATGFTGAMGAEGAEGETGPVGFPGFPGEMGATGIEGPQGETGALGAPGDFGVQGEKGLEGSQGEKGVTGAQGDTGLAPVGFSGLEGEKGSRGEDSVTLGMTGPQGPLGARGVQGVTGPVDEGDRGEQGITGPQGLLGERGAPGEQGSTGASGEKGDTGMVGAPGVQGLVGITGTFKGVWGSTGTQGHTGAQGEVGLQGQTGAKGPEIGEKGVLGEQGPQGIDGVQGATGPDNYVGGFGAKGLTGSQGIQGEQGTRGVYGLGGGYGPTGSKGAPGVRGVQGAIGGPGVTGPSGDTGPQGPQGPAGDPGLTGATGNQGSQGMTGGSGAIGPRGSQGPQGGQGPTGSQGTTGVVGPASVVQGVQGLQGVTGVQGGTGIPGVAGPRRDGLTGYKGNQGVTGEAGSTGPRGPGGAQGVQGDTGRLGAPGERGAPGVFLVGTDQWDIIPESSSTSWKDLCFGEDIWVAIASGASLLRSLDGRNWDSITVEDHPWYSVTYGDGKFLVVASDGYYMVSSDARTWTTYKLPWKLYHAVYAYSTLVNPIVCYAKGEFFIALGGVYIEGAPDVINEYTVSSDGGVTWRSGNTYQASRGQWSKAVSDGETVLLLGNTTATYTSGEGVVIRGGVPTLGENSVNISDICFLRNAPYSFYATGPLGVWATLNGTSWTQISSSGSLGIAPYWVFGEYIQSTRGKIRRDGDTILEIRTTPQGIFRKNTGAAEHAHEAITLPTVYARDIRLSPYSEVDSSILLGDNVSEAMRKAGGQAYHLKEALPLRRTKDLPTEVGVVAEGDTLQEALGELQLQIDEGLPPPGQVWSETSWGYPKKILACTYGEGTFVACGEDHILVSEDALSWMYVSGTLEKVTYGCGKFVGADSSGALYLSENGKEWSTLSSNWVGRVDVLYGDSDILVVIGEGHSLISFNGSTWYEVPLPAVKVWSSVSRVTGTTYAVSEDGYLISRAVENVNWEASVSLPSNGPYSLSGFLGKLYALSATGILRRLSGSWESVSTLSLGTWKGFTQDGGLKAISHDRIAWTTNGSLWKEKPLPVAALWSVPVYGSLSYVAFRQDSAGSYLLSESLMKGHKHFADGSIDEIMTLDIGGGTPLAGGITSSTGVTEALYTVESLAQTMQVTEGFSGTSTYPAQGAILSKNYYGSTSGDTSYRYSYFRWKEVYSYPAGLVTCIPVADTASVGYSKLHISTDVGITFSDISSLSSKTPYAGVAGPKYFVSLSYTYNSPSTDTWITLTPYTGAGDVKSVQISSPFYQDILYREGTYFILHSTSTLSTLYTITESQLTSITASSLGTPTSLGRGNLKRLSYANGRYFIMGNTGNAYMSYDAISWVEASVPVSVHYSKILYHGGKYICYPLSTLSPSVSKALVSSDGLSWSESPLSGMGPVGTQPVQEGGWVYCSNGGNIAYRSRDGLSWEALPGSPRGDILYLTGEGVLALQGTTLAPARLGVSGSHEHIMETQGFHKQKANRLLGASGMEPLTVLPEHSPVSEVISSSGNVQLSSLYMYKYIGGNISLGTPSSTWWFSVEDSSGVHTSPYVVGRHYRITYKPSATTIKAQVRAVPGISYIFNGTVHTVASGYSTLDVYTPTVANREICVEIYIATPTLVFIKAGS